MKLGIRIITFALSLLIVSCINSGSGQEWPQWRGTDRDSKVTGFITPAEWPGEFIPEWKINVGFGDATPALADGKLFVFTRIGGDEVLQCLDALTGNQLWKESYPAEAVTGPAARHPGPRSTPTVSNGKAVIIGATGIISCLDAKSGKLIWRNSDYANMVPVYFTGMSPIVYDNRCYAHLGSADTSAIIAFDLASGSIAWKYEGEGPAYASPDIMTIDNVKQIVFQTSKSMMGISVTEGRVLWTIPTPVERRYYNSSSPVIDGQIIYYTGQGLGSRAMKVTSEGDDYNTSQLWVNDTIGTTYNTPVLKDGYLYGLSDRGYLYSLNASNGETAWADTLRHRDFGSVIDAGEVLLSLSSSSNLVVYKPETGGYNQVAMIKVADTPTYAYPILSGNKIYIKDEEFLTLYVMK